MSVQEKFDEVRARSTDRGMLGAWRGFGLVVGLNTLGLFWPLAGLLALASSRLVFGDRDLMAVYGVAAGCLVCLLGSV